MSIVQTPVQLRICGRTLHARIYPSIHLSVSLSVIVCYNVQQQVLREREGCIENKVMLKAWKHPPHSTHMYTHRLHNIYNHRPLPLLNSSVLDKDKTASGIINPQTLTSSNNNTHKQLCLSIPLCAAPGLIYCLMSESQGRPSALLPLHNPIFSSPSPITLFIITVSPEGKWRFLLSFPTWKFRKVFNDTAEPHCNSLPTQDLFFSSLQHGNQDGSQTKMHSWVMLTCFYWQFPQKEGESGRGVRERTQAQREEKK